MVSGSVCKQRREPITAPVTRHSGVQPTTPGSDEHLPGTITVGFETRPEVREDRGGAATSPDSGSETWLNTDTRASFFISSNKVGVLRRFCC